MVDPFLWLTPLLAAGVLALLRFTGCDVVWGLDYITPRTQVVDFTPDPANPPTPRNDYSGWVGMVIQPTADIKVASLGRWCLPMSSQSHDVKIVDAATGMDVTGAAVAISLAGQRENAFAFVDMQSPVTLTSGQTYYLLSHEQTGGDPFLEYTLTVTPSAKVQVPSAAYADDTLTPPLIYKTQGSTGNCYGPVSAQYFSE